MHITCRCKAISNNIYIYRHVGNHTYLHNATLPSEVQCCINKTTRNPFKKQYSMLSEKT